MSNLLARFAENAFWMARYMGRAENLARIIDVYETLARDHQIGQQWFPIVQLNADDERFFDKHEEATPQAVLSFYVIDDTNPSSIRATVRMARENARSLRHLISTEMWMQLNVFYEYLAGLGARDIGLTRINRLCQNIKENCQTHTGIKGHFSATRPGTSTISANISSAPIRPRGCSTSSTGFFSQPPKTLISSSISANGTLCCVQSRAITHFDESIRAVFVRPTSPPFFSSIRIFQDLSGSASIRSHF